MASNDVDPTDAPTDPEPSYEQPGIEDASDDQAVDQDRGLADRLLLQEDADIEAAAPADAPSD